MVSADIRNCFATSLRRATGFCVESGGRRRRTEQVPSEGARPFSGSPAHPPTLAPPPPQDQHPRAIPLPPTLPPSYKSNATSIIIQPAQHQSSSLPTDLDLFRPTSTTVHHHRWLSTYIYRPSDSSSQPVLHSGKHFDFDCLPVLATIGDQSSYEREHVTWNHHCHPIHTPR